MSSSTAAASIIYLGFDVHKDSVTIAVLRAAATAPTRIDTYPNDFAKLGRVFEPPPALSQGPPLPLTRM